jgi:predicted NAD-dependent protein-ADP-ribosyltransferase YbiA (DUF1768 family)/transcriptional regulator with XRE-family HTH domain
MDAIDRIKELMKEQQINQTELAKKSGLHFSSINHILNRKQKLHPNTLAKIAIALSVPDWELTDNNTTFESQVRGYLEFGGEIKRINSLKDVEKWIKKNKPKIVELPDKAKKIRQIEKKNNMFIKTHSDPIYANNNIDLYRKEIYDCTKLNIWSFRKATDVRDNIQISLGNMCSGYPFDINGNTFYSSESAYIAGMFSNNTAEHQQIQIELQKEKNGYDAKKKIRRKYENKKREDWEEYNVQWMFYVVWQKCLKNQSFNELLKTKIPADAIIVENSTNQKGDTASFWGAKNTELEASRNIIVDFEQYNDPTVGEQLINEYNKINCIGSFTGVNCMGKILKLCQISLINNDTPPINYDLLKAKNIHLFGKLLTFD